VTSLPIVIGFEGTKHGSRLVFKIQEFATKTPKRKGFLLQFKNITNPDSYREQSQPKLHKDFSAAVAGFIKQLAPSIKQF
jgi:cysteine synthase